MLDMFIPMSKIVLKEENIINLWLQIKIKPKATRGTPRPHPPPRRLILMLRLEMKKRALLLLPTIRKNHKSEVIFALDRTDRDTR